MKANEILLCMALGVCGTVSAQKVDGNSGASVIVSDSVGVSSQKKENNGSNDKDSNLNAKSERTQSLAKDTTEGERDTESGVSTQRRKDIEVSQREKENKENAKSEDEWRFRVGGYGEVLGKWMDYSRNRFSGMAGGTEKERRAEVSVPRFVVGIDYRFSKVWSMGSEIEMEAGGTGSAIELENSENGEYETETEKGGEVALEQFHIDASVRPWMNFRVGHLILPVGLTNAHHEPNRFFGASRPEGETAIIPSTWHETGLEIWGKTRWVSYQAIVSAGLNANGFDRDGWVKKGKQGLFEADNFNSPAYTARVDLIGIKGLRIGGSFYYLDDAARNADKPQTYSSLEGKARVMIWSVDGEWRSRFATARMCLLHGYLGESAALSRRNTKLSNKSPYSRLTPIASEAVSYGGEVGIDIKGIVGRERCPALYPYARYEYYSPQHEGESGQVMDRRCEVSLWQAGLDWFVMPTLVVKAARVWRRIGGGEYNGERDWQVGVGYVGWWCKR